MILPIRIFTRENKEGPEIIMINVDSHDTITNIKEKIQNEININFTNNFLEFAGVKVNDIQTLEHYNINENNCNYFEYKIWPV